MKRKLFIITIPIIISIVGIIYFQVDWINKTYTHEYKKMNSLADTALRHALKELDSKQEDSVSKVLFPKLSKLADTVGIDFTSKDSLKISFNNTVKHKSPAHILVRVSNYRERITIQYPNILLKSPQSNTDEILMKEIDKIMSPFINTKDSLYYKSDSLKIEQKMQKYLSSYGIDDRLQLYFLKGDFSQLESNFLREYRPLGINRYTGERRWVGFYFHTHNGYIMKNMLLGSILSIILILIMIASFIYLIRTILKQKRLAEMKDDFIDNLTHEFKTPIATIAVAIEGLQNFNALHDKEKTERYLTISKNELSRLNSMVSNVLNVASQEKGSIELNITEVDLTNMVHEVVGMEHFRAIKEVKFELAIANDANQIKVDPVHFKNILTNLIDNAVKYSKETVEITITATKQKGNVCITIKDNGIGIPASELKYVFDKFYRVSNGNIYNVKGIGLGLSYVKSIIAAHNGTISVKSEINRGTEFSILIPLN